jgi:23S rRNA (pseudouridine1915-N3)-methyltransferase
VHIRILAIGGRQPGWVDEAVAGYTSRYPRDWRFELVVLKAAARGAGSRQAAVEREGSELLSRLAGRERVVLLDERGAGCTSRQLADRLSGWQVNGRDVALVIGGADGVSDEVRARAELTLALSRLTLPHGLARVLLAEQLYRAWALTTGHPYHRD